MGSVPLRALYAAGVIATAIIAVNGPMAALFLSDAARTAAAPSWRPCVVTTRVRVGAVVTEYFPMVAAERQGSYAELSRLRLASRRLKKSGSLRGPAVTGDCPRNYLAPRGVERLSPRPNHD
jgi:hypothetical protein